MKTKILGLLASGLLAGPLAASAAVVTWEMRGNLTAVTGTVPGFGSPAIGDQFVVTTSFDTNAALLSSTSHPPGTRYDYDNASLVMSVTVGASGPLTFTDSPTAPSSAFNRMILRNNSSDQPVNGQPADGISFGLLFDDFSSLSLIFRTDDLTAVTGPGLPANPFIGLADYPLSVFQYFGDTWSFVGDVTSVSRNDVPEPGSLALLSLGLLGLGMSRRKAQATRT